MSKGDDLQSFRADGETRTPDPLITSEVLYQLSYVGVCRELVVAPSLGAQTVLRWGWRITAPLQP